MEALLEEEVKRSEDARSPVSRQMLVRRLEREAGLSHRDAWAKVDEWCEERAPMVPSYLSGEFGTYWLKVVAIANVALGCGLFYWAVRQWQSKAVAWPWFCAGVLLFGIGGVLTYVRSLQREAAR